LHKKITKILGEKAQRSFCGEGHPSPHSTL